MLLSEMVAKYPTVELGKCRRCGNAWWFQMPDTRTCTTCGCCVVNADPACAPSQPDVATKKEIPPMKVAKAADKTPAGDIVSKELTFKLSEKDLAEKAQAMAELDRQIAELEKKRKEQDASYKQAINDRDSERHKLSAAVREGSEVRLVDATLVKDFQGGIVQYWHEGRLIEERAMTEGERQLDLEEMAKRTAKRAAAASAAKAKKPSKRENGYQPDALEKEDAEREATRDVIKAETKKGSKRSAVDGVYS